ARPCRANRIATARPIPVADPVTNATLRPLVIRMPPLAFVGPIARFQEVIVQFGFPGVRSGPIVVLPARDGRQRHEDRFDPTTGLEPKNRTSVIEQIEFDIAAAAIFLESTLPVVIGFVAAPLYNGEVSLQECIAAVAHKREQGLPIAFEVIKENATDTARLTAVR